MELELVPQVMGSSMGDLIQLNLDRDSAEKILYNLDPMSNIVDLSNDALKSKILDQLEIRKLNEKRFFEEIKKYHKEESKESTAPLAHKDIHTHNTKKINTDMSHLQGEARVGYKELLKVFGEPLQFNGYKVDWEWIIESDGVVATIYNWKNGPSYGYSGVTPEDIKDWNIGGYSSKAVELVKSVLLINGIKC